MLFVNFINNKCSSAALIEINKLLSIMQEINDTKHSNIV